MKALKQREANLANRDDMTDAEWTEAQRIRLLLVDDDDLFREALTMNLSDEQFDIVACPDGRACLEALTQDQQFDLILLDWRMPEMSGIEVLQGIKVAGINIPVVFLTAFASERNEATALDCGAVDFLDKSRSASVLARRIRILVRNAHGSAAHLSEEPGLLRIGDLEVHLRVNRAHWRGQLVPLTTTEFRVVQLLASRSGEDVSYRAIYDVVHGRGFIAGDGSEGYRTNVRSLIKRLRQKFREIDPDFSEIVNYAGFGYRWRPQEERPPSANGYAAAGKVTEAVSQLPIVRQMASRRRAAGESTRHGNARPVPGMYSGANGIRPPTLLRSASGTEGAIERESQLDHRPKGDDTP